jgi:hypothetical protein
MSIAATSHVGGFVIEDPIDDVDDNNNNQSKLRKQQSKNKSKQKNQSTDPNSSNNKRGGLNKNPPNDSFDKRKDYKKQDHNRNNNKNDNGFTIDDPVNDDDNSKGFKSSVLDPAFKMRNKEVQPTILGLGKFVVSPDDNKQVNSQNTKSLKQNINSSNNNNKSNKKGKNRNENSEFDNKNNNKNNNNNNNNNKPYSPTSNNSRNIVVTTSQMKSNFNIDDPVSDEEINKKQVKSRSNNQSNNQNNHNNQTTRVSKNNYGVPETFLVVNPKGPPTDKKEEVINRAPPSLPKEYKGLRRDSPIIKPHFSSQNHTPLSPYQHNKHNPSLKVNSRFHERIEGNYNTNNNKGGHNRNSNPYSLYSKPNNPTSSPNRDPYSLYPKPPADSDVSKIVNPEIKANEPKSSSHSTESTNIPVPPPIATPVTIVEKPIVEEAKPLAVLPPAPTPVLSLIPPSVVESVQNPKIDTPTVRTPIFKKSASINWADDDSDDD